MRAGGTKQWCVFVCLPDALWHRGGLFTRPVCHEPSPHLNNTNNKRRSADGGGRAVSEKLMLFITKVAWTGPVKLDLLESTRGGRP